MPCYHPKQAFFKINQDGKKEIEFCDYLQSSFERGVSLILLCLLLLVLMVN